MNLRKLPTSIRGVVCHCPGLICSTGIAGIKGLIAICRRQGQKDLTSNWGCWGGGGGPLKRPPQTVNSKPQALKLKTACLCTRDLGNALDVLLVHTADSQDPGLAQAEFFHRLRA